jgi:hypothetical protein
VKRSFSVNNHQRRNVNFIFVTHSVDTCFANFAISPPDTKPFRFHMHSDFQPTTSAYNIYIVHSTVEVQKLLTFSSSRNEVRGHGVRTKQMRRKQKDRTQRGKGRGECLKNMSIAVHDKSGFRLMCLGKQYETIIGKKKKKKKRLRGQKERALQRWWRVWTMRVPRKLCKSFADACTSLRDNVLY